MFFDFFRDLRSGMLCFGVHLRMQQLDRYLSRSAQERPGGAEEEPTGV